MALLKLYKQFAAFPFGKWCFSQVVGLRAPYFLSIAPLITELTTNTCKVLVRKRWRVLNHIKTVHAIAMCNAAELAAGLLMEASLPKHLRWIPKGMQVNYLKKATSTITATASISAAQAFAPGDFILQVLVQDAYGENVVEAHITMYLSERPVTQ